MNQLTLSLSGEKRKIIENMAQEANCSSEDIIAQAVDYYIDLNEWQTQRIKDRVSQADSPDAIFYSSDEVEHRIQIFKP